MNVEEKKVNKKDKPLKQKQNSVVVRVGKKYDLIYLIDNLKRAGVWELLHGRISSDYTKLDLMYLDSFLNIQKVYVFRTSRLAYRIFYKTEFITARTCKVATATILEMLSDIIKLNEYYSVINVAEYVRLNLAEHDKFLPYKKRMEFFRRLDKIKYPNLKRD